MTKTSGNAPVLRALPYRYSAEQWFATLRALPLPVLLSSGHSSHGASRFDILTADPETVLRTRHGSTRVTDMRGGGEREESGSPFEVLERYCPLEPENPPQHELPFTGGAIGYFGYELLHGRNRIDRSGKPELGLPDMLVGIYRWAIVVDHRLQQSWLVLRDLPEARREALLALLDGVDSAPATEAFRLVSPFRSNFSTAEYLKRFDRVIDYIHAGDCYQVNLAQCFSADSAGDAWTAFEGLQRQANAPFAAYIEDGDQAVLSFSPERFIRVTDGEVLTQPIKGTRARSSDPVRDLENRRELENSSKDRAENLMIVDLLRNDLGRVCAFGSVSVENLFETQSFSNVHHLVSTIRGRLERPEDVFALLEASFPGGSITGTPKLRSMEIINELETMPRSVYCGAIAWIDAGGNMDSNIGIRTLVKDGDRVHCWGGGGIVADSEGPAEYQETLDKISFLINNL